LTSAHQNNLKISKKLKNIQTFLKKLPKYNVKHAWSSFPLKVMFRAYKKIRRSISGKEVSPIPPSLKIKREQINRNI
jgi:hypothetical protein